MRISVVIPTYNSSKTIQDTINSVFAQTVKADEILVLDDGSTDNTVKILNRYKPAITVFQQSNKGVANARNTLCKLSKGDLIAFLDHDDVWHPQYLEVQSKLYTEYRDAVAFFTSHVDFYGYNNFYWGNNPFNEKISIKFINPVDFLKLYNQNPGSFGSMSFCCIPKRVLTAIGNEPFCVSVSGADDFYLFNLLPLFGSVVYISAPLVAYRITEFRQSANRLYSVALAVKAFELLEHYYTGISKDKLLRAFRISFASKRRHYAKILMGVEKTLEARLQLFYSLRNINDPVSILKSIGLLLLTYMPFRLYPKLLN